MAKKIVTVIIPVFNDGIYTRDAINSVLNSTYKNIEIIVVDDCSTDFSSLKALEFLEKKHTDITFIRLEKNIGLPAVRNLAISKAKGELILPLDSDDTFESTFIEKSVDIIQEAENISPVYCHTQHTGKYELVEYRPDWSFERLSAGNFIVSASLFYKKAWLDVGGYDESMKCWEDYDFWFRIAKKGYIGKKIDEVLFNYRHIKPVSMIEVPNEELQKLHNYIHSK